MVLRGKKNLKKVLESKIKNTYLCIRFKGSPTGKKVEQKRCQTARKKNLKKVLDLKNKNLYLCTRFRGQGEGKKNGRHRGGGRTSAERPEKFFNRQGSTKRQIRKGRGKLRIIFIYNEEFDPGSG